MCKAIPGANANFSNRVHAVFCTSEARHIKKFRHRVYVLSQVYLGGLTFKGAFIRGGLE